MKNVHVLAAALLASHTRGIAIEERGGGPPQTDVDLGENAASQTAASTMTDESTGMPEEVGLAQYSWATKC